jgi:mannan endo-1,4-beta-mannosidase
MALVVGAGTLLLGCQALAGAQGAGAADRPAEAAPVNRKASPEARALLHYLYTISGRFTLTGQHNYPNTIAHWTDRVYDFTGRYPAVFGQDFGFSLEGDKDSFYARPALIREIKRQYGNGSIITLTWHAVRPTDEEPVVFRESVQGRLSDFEWSELLTPGSNLHSRWCVQVDRVAAFLKQLRDARIPVLWRPYHEVNGGWFWWGGRKGERGSAALYRQLFDRLVNYHGLNNLIWVWNAGAPGKEGFGPGPYADFFPGLQYADVLSADIYGEFLQSYHDDLVALAQGRPIALGEVGNVPTPAVLKAQPKWTWFMTWSELVEEGNRLDRLREIFDAPGVLSREDPRVSEPMAAIRRATGLGPPEPITPRATPEAKALLAQLYSISERTVLSGQEDLPGAPVRASERVVEITNRRPAILGQDLGAPWIAAPLQEPPAPGGAVSAGFEDARKALVEEARRQHASGGIVTLTWSAMRPSDDESVNAGASIRGKLTDFEWNELLTPGSNLHQRWCAQVDAVAAHLKRLQEAGVAVLWRPYPAANGTDFWWAGRKGERGSAALYRQLYDRLVEHGGLRNLIWVWNAAAPGPFGGQPGRYVDYFPGLAYVDVLATDFAGGRYDRSYAELDVLGTGKVLGLRASRVVPAPEALSDQPRWAWVLVSSAVVEDARQAEALRALYADSRVVSRDSASPAKPQ